MPLPLKRYENGCISKARAIGSIRYECDDGILWLDSNGGSNGDDRPHVQTSLSCVFQADLTEKVWVEVKNLGDKMLFLNQKSSILVSAGTTGVGKANRIYYAPGFSLFGTYIEIELDSYDNKIYRRPVFEYHNHSFAWVRRGLL